MQGLASPELVVVGRSSTKRVEVVPFHAGGAFQHDVYCSRLLPCHRTSLAVFTLKSTTTRSELMNDPLRRLGPEVFLAVVADLGSSSAITAAEAVHPSWRELIQSHDRAVWLPEARRLGLKLSDPHEDSSLKIRDLCKSRSLPAPPF